MEKVKGLLKRFIVEEDGQAVSEYALILAIVVIGIVAFLATFRDKVGEVFQKLAEKLGTSTN